MLSKLFQDVLPPCAVFAQLLAQRSAGDQYEAISEVGVADVTPMAPADAACVFAAVIQSFPAASPVGHPKKDLLLPMNEAMCQGEEGIKPVMHTAMVST